MGTGQDIWVFISHSSEDYKKVKMVRDILEDDDFRPLLFFLKCLEDDDEVFNLLEREIRARTRFILCDSKNAQSSKWVQREIEVIKSLNRPYEIVDIDSPIEDIKHSLDYFKRRSSIFIWSTEDEKYNQMLADELHKRSFKVTFLPESYIYDYKDKIDRADKDPLHKKEIDILNHGYFICLWSRELTESETYSLGHIIKSIKDGDNFFCPYVTKPEGGKNWEFYKEIRSWDGVQTRCAYLNNLIERRELTSEESVQFILNDLGVIDNQKNK